MRVDAQWINQLVPQGTPDKAEFAFPKRRQLLDAVLRDRIDQSIGELVDLEN
jgi:hypothetical protein